MKNILKARKSGFTLVELLIVIIIIAILAGMMMLATGAATDTAEATRVINDLRTAKAAGILIYMDEGQTWRWLSAGGVANAATAASFDRYMDRPLFSGERVYRLVFQLNVPVDVGNGNTETRTLMGFNLVNNTSVTPSVRDKLVRNAERVGLYNRDGSIYNNSSGNEAVYMILH